jgi:hypothetical protein
MKSLLLIGALMLASVALAADLPQIKNAKIEQRSASTGLEQQVRALNGTAWIGYSVPRIAGDHDMCCYDGPNRNCCGGCRLEKSGAFFEGKSENCQQQLESSKMFSVFLRVDQGQVEKVRMFSTNCQIDGGGTTIYWVSDVKASDSVAYLAKLAESESVSRKDDRVDGAIAAIAMHDDASADQALAKLMTSRHSEHVLEQATFWAGVARGTRGYEIIVGGLERNSDNRFRKHAVFALSQNSDPRSQKKLIDMARHDSSSEIRSESLFWLAQAAGNKVAGVINAAIEDDPNTEVKKKAVFALSQLPGDEGVPLLTSQAEKNANPVVRKEAMFWLGQSDDRRAVDFITSVLER